MNIKVIPNNQLNLTQKEEIKSFIKLCFGKYDQKIRDLKYFSPTFAHLILEKDDKIASYLRILIREITFENERIKLGGLGDVCTHPDFRGLGLAGNLLTKAKDFMINELCDVALLQTNIQKGAKLYGTIGFVALGRHYLFQDANNQTHESGGAMLAPICSPSIFANIMNSHELLNIGSGDW